jgi:single-strand DNA-binding protein
LDRNRVRQERTEWHNVVVWGRRAEALSKFLTKGSRLFIEGGLRTSSYEDRDGNRRYRTEVVANNVILAGSSGRGGQRGDDYAPPPGDVSEPSRGGGGDPNGYGAGDYGGGGGGGDDDDIPF